MVTAGFQEAILVSREFKMTVFDYVHLERRSIPASPANFVA